MAENINKTDGMAMEVVIDDGTRKVPVKNHLGDEIGCFYFKPTDLDILKRYNAATADFDAVVKPLEGISIAADGTGTDEDGVKALTEATKLLYQLVDKIFDAPVAQAFFGKVNPFSPVAGNFLCVSMINAMGAFIEKQFNAEIKKLDKKLGKYTKTVKARK